MAPGGRPDARTPDQNPSRPVASHDRVDAIRKKCRQITMRVKRGGKRRTVESYLPEIFEIVVGTGRRITPVCSLRTENIIFERTATEPESDIIWPEDTDKQGVR